CRDAVVAAALDRDAPKTARAVADDEWRRPTACDAVDDGAELCRREAAALPHEAARVFGRALAQLAAVEVDSAHARLGGERDEARARAREIASTQLEELLGQHDDRASL